MTPAASMPVVTATPPATKPATAPYRRGGDKEALADGGGGEKFSDVVGLKQVLVQRQDHFARMLTDRMLTYACGRRIEALDEPILEKIVTELAPHKHGLRSLIEAVVTSELFLSR